MPAAPPGWLFVAGLACVYVAVVLVFQAISPSIVRVDPQRRGASSARGVAGAFDRALFAAERGLAGTSFLDRLATGLDRAGIGGTAARFVLQVLLTFLLAVVTGALLGGLFVAVFFGIVVAFGARTLLSIRTSRRQAAFADQLDDTLQLLAGSLRAGHSLLQAVDTVAQESSEPTSSEFRRIVNATRVGQDLSQAIAVTVDRTASADFSWVAQAIAIHREVGGNLAGVLDTVAETIRERNQIRRHVQALSAEGKLSAIVLMGLPVAIVAFLALISPGYLANFVAGPAGWIMLGTIALLMTVGGLWLRKIITIEY
ncbi:MAG: type II secretion system F family protein [Nitriliruptoraceae bacterium]